jgi:hypothetical protein
MTKRNVHMGGNVYWKNSYMHILADTGRLYCLLHWIPGINIPFVFLYLLSNYIAYTMHTGRGILASNTKA